MKKNLLTLLSFLLISASINATDYMIGGYTTQSSSLPFVTSSSTFTSITQQIYLASELVAAEASAGDIIALKFSFGNSSYTVREVTRNLEIYIKLVPASFTEFELEDHKFKFVDPGSSVNKVYDGNYTIPATTSSGKIERTINISRFYWDGTSNIVLTVIDKTNKKFYSMSGDDYSDYRLKSYGFTTTTPRYVHNYWMEADASGFATYKSSLAGKSGWQVKGTDEEEISNHKFINGIKFSIVPPIPVPTSPSAGSITTNSAVLSWTAAAGADSYEVRYGTTSGSLGAATNVGNVTSYSLSELTDETTYYYQIRTKKGSEYSAWTDESSFTTLALAAHTHDDITFSKWASTSSLPTSGDYYLNDDVAFSIMSSDVTLTGNLNLCLNGKTADLYGSKIIVPSGKTLTIYDNEGGGKITGYVASEVGISEDLVTSLIVVKGGGTLVLKQGTIENTYIRDADGNSYAIYSNGTLRISGDVLINSNDADIYLYSTNVVTLDGALGNDEKHTVYKTGGAITSGWSTYMSSADPRDYFESANSARSVCLNENEASLRLLLNLSESSLNSSISTSYNQLADINLTRSVLTSASYNTICLPFALSNAQLEEYFGAGYDLRAFVSSSLEEDVLSLTFSDPLDALAAGKPYLLQPSIDVVNPSFEGVTISATSPVDQTSDANISFHGTYAPTELTGGNHNLLFLGADNELFWPESTANLKGFRAYFEIKGSAAQAAKRARIVKKEDSATGIDIAPFPSGEGRGEASKLLRDGMLFIERDGKTFNAQGQRIK